MGLRKTLSAIFSFFSRPAPGAALDSPAQGKPPVYHDADGKLSLANKNFSIFTFMSGGEVDEFKRLLKQARNDRSPQNLYEAALSLHNILRMEKGYFLLGAENIWLSDMARVRDMAAEAASHPDTTPKICNFAGVLHILDWGFEGIEGASIDRDGNETPIAFEPHENLPADPQKALEFFQRGADLGDDICAENARRAQKSLAAEQAAKQQTPPPSAPPPPAP